MHKNHFIILGHCNTTLGIILDSLYSLFKEQVTVTIINNIDSKENRFDEMPYLHHKITTKEIPISDFRPQAEDQYILTGMSPKIKKIILNDFKNQAPINTQNFYPIIHKSAVITNGVTTANSVNISPLSVIAQYATLHDFVTINRNVSVGHHTVIEAFSSINPGCNIGGNCHIGSGVTIGIGATVFDGITIGDNAIIGGGAVVTKDVKANTLVFGSPAKFIKEI